MDALVNDFAEIVDEVIGSKSSGFVDGVERFYSSVLNRAAEAGERKGTNDAGFAALELETRLWRLVQILYTARLSGDVDPHIENRLVLGWLEEMARGVREPEELRTIKWMYTKNTLRQSQLRSTSAANSSTVSLMVSELDADAPVRQGKQIAEEDASADSTFFRYIFELLLTGNREKAAKECAQTNNWGLKAAIEASPTNELAKRTFWAVASTSALSRYEKAVYGILCGDVQTVLPLCQDWESKLFAYVNALTHEYSRNSASLPAPKRLIRSLEEALDAVDNGEDHKVRLQGQDLRRVVIKAVITGTVDDLATQLVHQAQRIISRGADAPSELLKQPQLLRVLLHLQIILPKSTPSTTEFLLVAYIEYLNMLGDKLPWIPAYVRLLPPGEARTTIYSRVLAGTTDPGQREMQLYLSQRCGIDYQAALRAAFELVQSNSFHPNDAEPRLNIDVPLSETPEPDDASMRLISALEWFVVAQMWDDAVSALVFMFRTYLLQAQPKVALDVGDRVSLGSVAGRATPGTDRSEVLEYAKLVQALSNIRAWDALPRGGAEWRSKATEHVGLVMESVKAATMLFDQSQNPTLLQIRRIYVPFLLLELVRVLLEAKAANAGYALLALDTAVMVADEETKLYSLLVETRQLSHFMTKMAQADIDGV